ncbi:MAG TPA: hypothetical protein VJT31_11225, partial [Rugosimonospora sp.]|nr:hypothetical protein [Rugosimonospora sp.]
MSVQATATTSNRPRTPRVSLPVLLAAGAIVSFGAAATFTAPGAVALAYTHRFLEFFSGVFSLVALSIAVMIGLAATDRIILLIRHRVLLQAVHRAMAFSSVAFLAIHVSLKIAEAHASAVDVVVPFVAQGQGPFVIYMGLGTIASYCMIIATWTGIIRGRFAGSSYPGLWRALHITTYAAWPMAIVHGLLAGRHAKTWVTVSYILCGILVLVGLLVRVLVTWNKRMNAPKATTTGTIKPVGKMSSPALRPAVSIPIQPPPMPVDPPPADPWEYADAPVSSMPVSGYPGRRDSWTAPVPDEDEWSGSRRDNRVREEWAPAPDEYRTTRYPSAG